MFKHPVRVAMKAEALGRGWRLIANDWLCRECVKKAVTSTG